MAAYICNLDMAMHTRRIQLPISLMVRCSLSPHGRSLQNLGWGRLGVQQYKRDLKWAHCNLFCFFSVPINQIYSLQFLVLIKLTHTDRRVSIDNVSYRLKSFLQIMEDNTKKGPTRNSKIIAALTFYLFLVCLQKSVKILSNYQS